MRLCHLCLAILLSACTKAPAKVVLSPSPVPPDLLRPCAGHQGSVPRTEGALARAILAEAQGRACANAKLATVKAILEDPAMDDR